MNQDILLGILHPPQYLTQASPYLHLKDEIKVRDLYFFSVVCLVMQLRVNELCRYSKQAEQNCTAPSTAAEIIRT